MMPRNKHSRASLRILFSGLFLLFMFILCAEGARSISILFEFETEIEADTENCEIPLETDPQETDGETESEQENKNSKEEYEFDDVNFMAFFCTFNPANFSLPTIDHTYNWCDPFSPILTPPPEV